MFFHTITYRKNLKTKPTKQDVLTENLQKGKHKEHDHSRLLKQFFFSLHFFSF